KIDIRGVVQLHRTELAERDHAKLRRCAATSIVNTPWQAVTIVEILACETERVVEYRVGKIRQLFHRLDERLRATNVVQVSAQQLAATKAREQHLRIQSG